MAKPKKPKLCERCLVDISEEGAENHVMYMLAINEKIPKFSKMESLSAHLKVCINCAKFYHILQTELLDKFSKK